jgi:hypothetical protein
MNLRNYEKDDISRFLLRVYDNYYHGVSTPDFKAISWMREANIVTLEM